MVHHEALLANGDVPLSGIITPRVKAPSQLATGNYAQDGLRVGDWGGMLWGNTHDNAVASSIKELNPRSLTDLQRKMLLQGEGTTRDAGLSSVAILNHRNDLAGIARENLDKSVQKRERIGRIMDALSNKQVALRQRIEADVAQANAPVTQAKKGLVAGFQRFFGFQN